MRIPLITIIVVAGVVAAGCSKKQIQQSQSTESPAGASVDTSTASSGAPSGPTSGASSSSSSSLSSSGDAAKGVATQGVAVSGAGAPSTQGKSGSAATGTGSLPAGAVGAPVLAQGAQSAPAAPAKPAEPPKPVVECFTVSYQHKASTQHATDEACSHHQNVLKLPTDQVSRSSVCVRVDGTPVAYRWVSGKKDELLLGAVAGPTSKISVRYCVGKSQCQEDCKIPKDEFMEALGAAEDDGNRAPGGKWDANAAGDKEIHARLDAGLKKELADLDEGTEIFKDWMRGDESPACRNMKSARAGAPREAGS